MPMLLRLVMYYTLRWSHSCPAGRLHWSLFGVREDGSFYGEVLLRSSDPEKHQGSWVEGRLTASDCQRMTELFSKIKDSSSVDDSIPSVGRLFVRLSITDRNLVRPVFDYRPGDEAHSESAFAFLELIKLLSPTVEGSVKFKLPHHNDVTEADDSLSKP